MKKNFGIACWFNIQKLNIIYFTILLARRIKILFQKIQNLISKIEYPFMVKKSSQPIKNKNKFLQSGKGSLGKYTANIIYRGKDLNGLSLRPATWQDHPIFATSIEHCVRDLLV